jgi:hypothetical protein
MSEEIFQLNKETFLDIHKGHDVNNGSANDKSNNFSNDYTVIVCKSCNQFYVATESNNKNSPHLIQNF